MDVGIFAQYSRGSFASSELVILHAACPQPLVSAPRPLHTDAALVTLIVASKRCPMLQASARGGRHIPRLPNPLKIAGLATGTSECAEFIEPV